MALRVSGFVEWAEPAPLRDDEDRYAITRDFGAIKWARFSPNPDVSVDFSSGCFYDTGDPADHPEGAIEWARASAILHKAKVRRLLT